MLLLRSDSGDSFGRVALVTRLLTAIGESSPSLKPIPPSCLRGAPVERRSRCETDEEGVSVLEEGRRDGVVIGAGGGVGEGK